MIDNTTLLAFSPTEYKLFIPLLSGQSAKDETLVNTALGYNIEMWNRRNLGKYVEKLRSKSRPARLDVHRVTGHGYILITLWLSMYRMQASTSRGLSNMFEK